MTKINWRLKLVTLNDEKHTNTNSKMYTYNEISVNNGNCSVNSGTTAIQIIKKQHHKGNWIFECQITQ